MTKTRTPRSTKARTTTKASKTEKTPKTVQLFQGTVPATKVFRRKLTGFSPKTPAFTFLLLNETTTPHTVVFCNTYNEEQHPKASFNPSHYQTEYVAKVHAPKVESMEELEVTEWPEWIRNARAKSRKTK